MNKNRLNINVADKPKGAYYVTVQIGGNSKTNKIIVE